MNAKIYVGCNAGRPKEIFRSVDTPTFDSHGHLYAAVIGPFRRLRGARFMLNHGYMNPHCRTVGEAEKLALGTLTALLRV